ncbi:hypothetical protein PISL3812_05765 [Talaromyces islandicus]|uniref:Uncharacterized protein n=1 Tax=Talaromyces islandicus TaxID=28573 RepID=A0A0U1M192_TALIS|nr:hypothetical protein PISL3812_05765 [Talaromyces islandicus]
MPRLPTSLLLKSYRENPLLPRLLKECRTLESARNELRWLRDGAIKAQSQKEKKKNNNCVAQIDARSWQLALRKMCALRSKGKPLQYILGDQPFGELEILCEKGVLIPRVETELYTIHAKDLILEGLNAKKLDSKGLRVLDVCSGSGCISLLLHSLLAPHVENLTIAGLDVSPHALNLSLKNKAHNINNGLLTPRAEKEVIFQKSDMLDELDTAGNLLSSLNNVSGRLSADTSSASGQSTWDVLISNPPYISPSDLVGGKTSRSVRKYEPMQALVPPVITKDRSLLWEESLGLENVSREDIFYPRLLYLARKLGVKLVVFECGDIAQARRIVDMARVIFTKGGGNENLSIYTWSGYYNSSDCDEGARAVVVRRF